MPLVIQQTGTEAVAGKVPVCGQCAVANKVELMDSSQTLLPAWDRSDSDSTDVQKDH